MSDDLLERAVNAYHAEYHRHWRDGGDAQDHDEAHRCGLEAALALSTVKSDRLVTEEFAWSLDTSLATVIADGCAMLARLNNGYPDPLTNDEWLAILGEIETGFRSYAAGTAGLVERTPEFERAFDLLRKWWGHLWD